MPPPTKNLQHRLQDLIAAMRAAARNPAIDICEKAVHRMQQLMLTDRSVEICATVQPSYAAECASRATQRLPAEVARAIIDASHEIVMSRLRARGSAPPAETVRELIAWTILAQTEQWNRLSLAERVTMTFVYPGWRDDEERIFKDVGDVPHMVRIPFTYLRHDGELPSWLA